jgi:hypothetical protein
MPLGAGFIEAEGHFRAGEGEGFAVFGVEEVLSVHHPPHRAVHRHGVGVDAGFAEGIAVALFGVDRFGFFYRFLGIFQLQA